MRCPRCDALPQNEHRARLKETMPESLIARGPCGIIRDHETGDYHCIECGLVFDEGGKKAVIVALDDDFIMTRSSGRRGAA